MEKSVNYMKSIILWVFSLMSIAGYGQKERIFTVEKLFKPVNDLATKSDNAIFEELILADIYANANFLFRL